MSEHHDPRLIRRAYALSAALHAMLAVWFAHRLKSVLPPPVAPPLAVEFRSRAQPRPIPLPLPPPPQVRPEQKAPPPKTDVLPARRAPTPQLTRPANAETPPPDFSVATPGEPVAAAAVTAPAGPAPAPPPGPAVFTGPQFNAAYLNNPAPEYPATARRRRQQGTAYLEVRVAADGRPVAIDLSRSSGIPELDDAAIRAVRGWTFVPARRGSEAVAASVEVPIRFTLDR